ncbi:lysophospholipid acyltransferase family protein [soil metagenome]
MIIFSYLLYYLIIIPVSLLPFPVLYLLSDFLFLIFYSVVGYRKKVVFSNLKNSFPEKSEKELQEIMRKFYHHFCDIVVETLKSFTISQEQIRKRMVLENPEILEPYYKKQQSVILAGGHYNNWEWIATGAGHQMKHQAIAVYKTLTNRFFDEKMRTTRSKFGLLMISTRKVAETLLQWKDQPTATIFAFDQSPSKSAKNFWMKFLNQDTAMLFGTEKYAKEYNYPVFFGYIDKHKRGYYSFRLVLVTDTPLQTAYGDITEKINHLLEDEIKVAPEYWLWTHRRWKHKKPVHQ